MQYRQFGKITPHISALGFGCMRLPTRKNPFDLRVDTKEAIKLIRRAIEQGVNYFDTAWPYHLGASEKILGQALQDGYREKVFLVSKLPMFVVKKAEDFDRIFTRQLEKLQTDHLDAYLFHGLSEGSFQKIKELGLIAKMEKARETGLIKYIGFSFHDTLPVFKEIVDFYPWDLVQIQYNYLDTTVQATTEGLEYAAGKGMGIVIMEPLKGGLLAHPPQEALTILNDAHKDRTPVDWALQFLWNKKEVAVVLSGMGSQQMLTENCASAQVSGIDSLSADENKALADIVEIYKKRILVPCTACKYCMPCPEGVNIPQNFALLNNANVPTHSLFSRILKWLTKRKYKKLVTKPEKVNKAKPDGNAILCIECGKCVPHCPQSIMIPDELKKVYAVMTKKEKPEVVFIK